MGTDWDRDDVFENRKTQMAQMLRPPEVGGLKSEARTVIL